MIGTFKANNPVNTVLLFIYGLALKLSFFSHLPAPASAKSDNILFSELLLALQSISSDLPFIYSLITYLLLFTQAVTFNKIVNDVRLMQRSTYLPAMSYMLITSLFPEWNILSSALIANTLLIWVWLKLNTLYHNIHAKTVLFNIGMATGISALFYFPSIAFALLIVCALMLTRPFIITEWIITLIGITTPFYYFIVWFYLSDNFKYYKLPALSIGYPNVINYRFLVALTLSLTGLVTGAYFVQSSVNKQPVQIRQKWTLMSLYLLIALLIPFINNTHSFKYWVISAVPLSAFTACAFYYPSKKWFPVLLHWLMVLFVIVISYFHK